MAKMEKQKEATPHQVVLEFQAPIKPEVPVGSNLVLKVSLTCPEGCNLSSRVIRLMSGEEVIQEFAGVPAEDAEGAQAPLKAPMQVGTYSWTVLFPRQEINGIVHEEASLPVTFATQPHGSSLAVWDVPSTVVTGEPFRVKVGARSSAGHSLKGTRVEILNSEGQVAGRGEFGDTPWPGTAALYWTEVELAAPSNDGVTPWSARFGATDSEVPHSAAQAEFRFTTVPPPEHKITVRIVEQESKNPIENVQIRVGPFRSATNESGVAEFGVPKGSYEMSIWHPKWESPATTVEVSQDATVQIESTPVPEDDPDAMWR